MIITSVKFISDANYVYGYFEGMGSDVSRLKNLGLWLDVDGNQKGEQGGDWLFTLTSIMIRLHVAPSEQMEIWNGIQVCTSLLRGLLGMAVKSRLHLRLLTEQELTRILFSNIL